MFRLAIRTLRFRAIHFFGVFTAVFCGAAIIMACGGLMETGIRLNAPPERLQTPIVIAPRGSVSGKVRLQDDILEKVRATSGVKQAIPDISFAAEIENQVATTTGLYGHPWASADLTPYTFISGNKPSQNSDVVLTAEEAHRYRVASGDQIRITVKGDSSLFRVSGIIRIDTPYTKPLMFFSDHYSQERVDAIGVVPQAGTSIEHLQRDLKASLASDAIQVLTGNERGLGEYKGISGAQEVLIAGSAPFGGNTIVVVIFVVASILSLSIRQRMRELALLQTIGATPGQIRLLVVLEAMIVSILAVAAAILPGAWLGEFMLSTLKASGLVPSQLIFYQGYIPVSIGVAVGLISSLVASLIAAHRATTIQPIEALAEIATQRRWFSWWRIVFAIVGLAGGLSLALVTAFVMRGALASSTAGPAVLPWLLAFALLAPALIVPGIALMSLPLRTFKQGIGYLALKNMRVRYVQSAAIVTPVMLASSMVLSMLYQQTTLTDMTEDAYSKNVKADVFLAAKGNGITLHTASEISKIHGVTASSPIVVSEGHLIGVHGAPEKEALRMQGVDPTEGQGIFDYQIPQGRLQNLNNDGIALSEAVAQRISKNIGDEVSVRFGDGRDETLKLVATYQSPAGFDSALVSAQLLAHHTGSGLVPLIAVKSSLTNQQLEQNIGAAVKGQPLEIMASDTLRQRVATQTSVLSWVNTLFAGMVTLYALLFLTNTLLIAIVARRREFALQQLIGSSQREILRMVTLEAVALAVIGVMLGIIVSSVTLVPFSVAVNGTPFVHGPLTILLSVFIGSLLLCVAVALCAALYSLRTRPIKAASNRE